MAPEVSRLSEIKASTEFARGNNTTYDVGRYKLDPRICEDTKEQGLFKPILHDA